MKTKEELEKAMFETQCKYNALANAVEENEMVIDCNTDEVTGPVL